MMTTPEGRHPLHCPCLRGHVWCHVRELAVPATLVLSVILIALGATR
jgi:hypothetical protein